MLRGFQALSTSKWTSQFPKQLSTVNPCGCTPLLLFQVLSTSLQSSTRCCKKVQISNLLPFYFLSKFHSPTTRPRIPTTHKNTDMEALGMPVHSSEQLIRIKKLISLQHCQAKLQVFPTLPSRATLSWRKTKQQAGLQRHKPEGKQKNTT